MANLNRYLCDVLEDMRTALKVLRVDMLPGLIEEAQVMGNRMESKLSDYSDLGYNLDESRKLSKGIESLSEELEALEKDLFLSKTKESTVSFPAPEPAYNGHLITDWNHPYDGD